jgi:hypothetical protein
MSLPFCLLRQNVAVTVWAQCAIKFGTKACGMLYMLLVLQVCLQYYAGPSGHVV